MTSFPKAILHVDGDSFFVSCELTRRPELVGKPVVTGQERGMATAVNYEAKALGVVRGMRTYDIRRNYPQVTILSSDYRIYSQYAQRMYAIVRRHADAVEEYSIDECFADITQAAGKSGVEAVARAIQDDLHALLGVSFSVGVGVNKCTAKVASKWQKPRGLTLISREAIPEFLKDLPIGKVWGIGTATTIQLRKLGIATALDLARKDRAWVAEYCAKPLAEIYEEFQGAYVKELAGDGHGDPISVQHTRTFHPSTRDRAFLWSQLSYHAEDACARLRQHGLEAVRASFFLKSQEFQYFRSEAELPDPSAAPEEVLRAIRPVFDKMWEGIGSRVVFRAAGISLAGLRRSDMVTGTLFGLPRRSRALRAIHGSIDRMASRFGREAVFLGSSFKAMKHGGRREAFGARELPLDLIYLGEVH